MKRFYLLTTFISIMCFSSFATTWYSLSSASNATVLASWNSSSTGGGSTPTTFGAGADIWIIQTNGMTCAATWTVAGSLQIGSGGVGSLSVTTSPTITGKITVNAGGLLTINTTGTVPSLAATQNANSTITFAGSGSYTIPAVTYGSLSLTSSGTSTFAGACTVAGAYVQSAGTVTLGGATTITGGVTINGGTFGTSTYTLSDAGNFSNSGTFAPSTGTVAFTGSGTQTIGGSTPTTFYNLTINNTSSGAPAINGVTLGAATTVSHTLTFTSGILNASSYAILLPGAAAAVSGAAAGKYVYGTETKTLSGLASVTFEVGDNSYAPALLTLNGTATAGTISVSANAAGTFTAIPNYSTSLLASSNYIVHYWTVANSGVAGFTAVTPKFTYNLADITGGSNTGFVGQVYNSGSWSSVYTNTNTIVPYTSTSTSSITNYTGNYILGLQTPPTITAAAGATVDNQFSITFTDNAAWRAAITQIKLGATVLPIAAWSAAGSGAIVFTPSVTATLQTSGTNTITIIATGFVNQTVSQTIGAGVATKLYMATQPTAPAYNGCNLATQPVVGFKDQYGNITTSFSSSAPTVTASATTSPSWTLEGTASMTESSGQATFSGLGALNTAGAVTGAALTFSVTGMTSVTSTTFNIPAPATITVAPGTLTFSSVYGTTSASQNITVSGTNLCSGITVTPPTNYQVQEPAGAPSPGTWTSSPFTISASGTLGATTIPVEFLAPANSGVYTGTVTFTNVSAATGNVALTGTSQATVAATPTTMVFTAPPSTTSAAQTLTLAGGSLAGTITLTPPTNFQILNPATGTYTTGPVTITASGSTITPTTISVEYTAPNTPGIYTGSITVTSPYTTTQYIALTGENSISGTFTYGTGGNFATLAAAITFFNTYGINNSVVLNSAVNGWTETAPAGGYKLGSATLNASLNSTTTLIINGYPGGSNTILTAPVGTGANDFIFALSGCDYITFDGLTLQESASNTTATTRMEMGFAFFDLNLSAPFDGCQNDEIENCTITLNAANTNYSYGIATYHKVNTGTAITPTATVDLHSNNKFYANTISNCFTPILLSGYAAASPYTLYDQSNDVGGSVSYTGNTFTDFGSMGSVSNTAYGIALINQNNANASYNTMNNATGGANSINTLYGVYCSGVNSTFTVGHNTINLTEANGGSATAFDGIYLQNAGSSLTANNNKVTLNEAAGSSVTMNGISNTGSNLTANQNNISLTSGIAVAAATQGIATAATSVLISQYDTIAITQSVAATANTYFISNTGNASSVTMNYNRFTGSLNTTGSVAGLNNTGTGSQLKMDNNYLNISNSPAAPGNNYGLYNTQTYTNNEMNNNTITLALASATSGTAYGIDVQGGGSATFNSNNNTINVTAYNVYGDYYVPSVVSSVVNFNSNSITTNVTAGNTYGMYFANTGATSNINESSNTINNTSTTGSNYGIYNNVTAATDTNMYVTYNNITCLSTTGVISGLWNESRYSNITMQSWNTINISNTASSSNGMYFIHNAPGNGGTNYSANSTSAVTALNHNTFKSTSGLNTTNTSQFGEDYSGGVCLIDDNFPNALDSVCYNHTSGTIANTAASGQFIGLYLMQMNTAYTNYDVFVGNNFSNISLSGSNVFVGIGRGTYQQQPLVVAYDTLSNITSGTGYIAGVVLDFVNYQSVTKYCQFNNFTTGGDVYGISYSYFQPNYPEPTLTTRSLAVYGGSIYNNNINNLQSTAASGTACGINYYPIYGSGTFAVNNDTVYNISVTGTTAPSAYGIYNSPYLSNNVVNLYNNLIHDISGQGATGNTVATGIYFANNASGTNTYNIYDNDVYNISTASSGTTSQALGVYLTATSGTFNIYNNFISALTAPASANPQSIVGLYMSATGATWNTYFNTIRIGTASTAVSSTGTNFGAAGVLYPNGASLLTLENNIINMNVTPSGTGVGSAVQRNFAATAGTAPTTSNFMPNYNIYNINANAKNYMYVECASGGVAKNGFALSGLTNSAANDIYNDASFNVCASLYKAFIGSGRDQRTYSENNLSAGTTTGTFVPSGSSWAYQNGIAISTPAITLDWAGATRSTTPSIGASEFSGSLPSNGSPVVDFTPITNTSYCPSNAPSLSASILSGAGINTVTGTKPRMYYKKTTETNAFSTTNNTSTFNGWKYVEASNSTSPFTFTPNYSLLTGSVSAGTVIEYFVVAQDLNATPNVGYSQVALSTCQTSVAISTVTTASALPVINTYSVLAVPAFTTQVTPQFFCSTGNPAYLKLSANTGDLKVQWQSSTNGVSYSTISGATTTTYAATPPSIGGSTSSGSIYFNAILSCGSSSVAVANSGTATEYQPQVTPGTAQAICGTATASLTATNNAGTIYWYTGATGGTPIAVGSPYTPTLSATTTYYAADSFGTYANPQSVGMRAPVAPALWALNNPVWPGGILTGFHQEGFDFTVSNPMTLESVDVYPYYSGNYVISLYNASGAVLFSQTFALTGNSSTPTATTCTFSTPSNWYLPTGTYELAFSALPSTPGVWADNSGISYPYTDTTSDMSITGVTYYTGYYFFYNWKVYSGCISPRTAVTVTDNSIPSAGSAAATPINACAGSTVTLSEGSTTSGTGTMQSYTWNGPGGYTSSATASTVGSVTTAATASGYYSLTVTYPGNGCTSSPAITYVTVGANVTPTVTPATASVCTGATYTLTATPASGTWSIGSGSSYASVNSSGVVTGIAPGTATVSYTTLCGAVKVATITVNQSPASITGPAQLCIYPATGTFSNTTSGGVWSNTPTTYGTINASTGIFSSAYAVGITTVSYTQGGCTVTQSLVIDNSSPAPIAGTLTSCVGGSQSLYDITTGGVWSTSNPALATVSSTGLVTGVGNGTAIITYNTGCGTAATQSFTVSGTSITATNAGPYCAGSTINLAATIANSVGATYSWTGPNGFTSASLNPVIGGGMVSSSGLYSFVATQSGCTQSAVTFVVVDTTLNVTTSASPATICAGGSSTVSATVVGPTAFENYPIAYAPVTFTPSATLTSSSAWTGGYDDGYVSVAMPFSFDFYGTYYSTVYIDVNGYVTFGSGVSTDNSTAKALPSTSAPSTAGALPMIALFWNNLDLSSGSITYGTTGTAPFRQFVISYNNVADGLGTNSGQIIMYESTNSIDLMVGSAVSANMTCGVQNAGGTQAVTVNNQNNTNYQVSGAGEGWRFATPSFTYLWSPSTYLTSSNIAYPTAVGVASTTTYGVNTNDVFSQCPSGNVSFVTVTTSNGPQASSLTAAQNPICNGGSTIITAGSIVGGSGTVTPTYEWSYTDPSSSVHTLSSTSANTVTITPSNGAGAYTYSVVVSEPLGGCGVGNATTMVYTVVAQPTASVTPVSGSTTQICTSAGSLSLNGSVSGGVGTPTYAWAGPLAGDGSHFSSTSLSPTYSPTVGQTSNGVYTLAFTYPAATGCSIAPLTTGTVSVNDGPAMTAFVTPTVCVGATTAPLIYTVTGAPTTYGLVWNAAALTAGFTNVSTGTTLSASPLTLGVGSSVAASNVYTGRITITNPTTTCSGSQNINVAVSAQPTAGTITPSISELCNGGNSVFTVGSTSGGSGTVASYTWTYEDPTSSTHTLGTVTSNTLAVTPGAAGTGNYVYTVTANMTGAGCTAMSTNTLTVVAQPSAIVSPSTTNICTGTPLSLSGTVTGGAGNATAVWAGPIASDGSNFSNSGTLTAGTSTLAAVYNPSVTSSGSYSLALTYAANTGCVMTPVTTSAVTFSNPPTITLGTPAQVCPPATTDNLTYSGTTGSPNVYNITWNATASSAGFSNVSGATLPATPIVLAIPGGASANTYTGNLTVSNGSTCTSEPAYTFSVTVMPGANASIASANNVCTGYPAYVTFNGTPNAAITYSVSLGSVTSATLSAGGSYTASVGTITNPTNVTLISANASGCVSTFDTVATLNPLAQNWQGTTNNDWNTPTNWGCGFVPVATNNVYIPSGTANPPVIGSSATGTVGNFTVAAGATVTMDGGSVLTVNGNMHNDGNLTGDGLVNIGGAVAQTLSGQSNITNLQINNAAGVNIASSSDTLWLNGMLTMVDGNFNTNGTLVVVVDSNGTSGNIGQIAGGSITGNVIMKQWIRSGRRAYRFWGHPFSNNIPLSQLEKSIDITGQGGSANGFTSTTTNAASAFWYDNHCANAALTSDPGWIPFLTATPNATLTPTDSNFVMPYEGIRIMERGAKGQGLGGTNYTPSASAISQWGTINTGNINIPIYNYGAGKAYNQVSNPYPSPVDIGTIISNASAAGGILGPLFYVWNPYIGTAGAYQNITIGSPYYLQPNSSFQVRAATSASVTPVYLNFTESNKANTVSTIGGVLRTIPKFSMLSIYDANYHPYDSWYVSMNDEGTDGEDAKLDGGKPVNPDVNFYSWSADNTKLSADVRPYSAGKVIPLGFFSDVAQDYIIKVDAYTEVPGNDMYLHDILLNTFTKLEDGVEYNFSVTNDVKTQGDKRFEIVMGTTAVAQVAAPRAIQVTMTPNPATDEVTIAFNNAKEANTSLRVTDISGVCIYSENLGVLQSGKATISLDRFAAGMYMMELVSGDDKVVERLVKE